MQVLSDEESWKLFCRTAIPEEDGDSDTCPPGLEEMGQKMVKKCGGLPLAIVVLGGLLSLKPPSPIEWEIVLNNMQAHFARANGVDAVLSLSYVDLPHNLKSCFLYMGLFPEDRVIPKRRLLQLWMAEGFVAQQEEEDGQRTEGRAEEYLNELINRNLVQAAKMSAHERVTTCRIHDLVRDLCIKKARELNFFKISLPSSTSSPTSSRRLSVYHKDMDCYDSREASIPYIRSLLFFNMKHPNLTFSHRHFELLRVLDLGDVPLTITTITFGKLIHLRYLRLTVDLGQVYPWPSVPNCWGNWRSDHLYLPTSLQTLTMEYYKVDEPFYSFRNVRGQYKPVRIEGLRNLQTLPVRIEGLRNLQTLGWILSSDWLKNDTSELTSLRQLKIKADIRGEKEAAQLSNSIAKCQNLRSLCLSGTDYYPCLVMNSWPLLTKLQMKGCIRKLPEAHEFPPSLTQLTLENTELGNESMVILEKLPKLLTLRLRGHAFTDEEVQVMKDGFPQLTSVVLKCYTRLAIDKGGMPKLTGLQIYGSWNIIEGLGELLHLRKVDIITMRGYDYALPDLPSPSQWHQIKRKNEEGEIICSFLRK